MHSSWGDQREEARGSKVSMHSSWGDQREEARGSDVSMHSLWGDQRKEERGSKVSTAEISISRHHSSSIEGFPNIAEFSI